LFWIRKKEREKERECSFLLQREEVFITFQSDYFKAQLVMAFAGTGWIGCFSLVVSRKKGPSLLTRIGLKWGSSSHNECARLQTFIIFPLGKNNLENVLVTFNEIEDIKNCLFENKKTVYIVSTHIHTNILREVHLIYALNKLGNTFIRHPKEPFNRAN
jgi:hypothetical protein